jgi:multiple sugar transport system ATP-binding protein
MAEIHFDSVVKRFGHVAAVSDLTLTVEDREFLVLLGPSGCGKTTALRLLAGLESPTDGRIYLDGREITNDSPRDRNLAMVFQSYALYPHMSVYDNISYSLRLRHLPKQEVQQRVAEVARMLQITELLQRRPRQLSGGQRQRVALGRAVVRHPAAFLMDEPLSNLDAKLRTETRAEITRLQRELATTCVYVTHDQVEAMTMATRIAVMADGRLQQVGTPAEVYDRPASTFVAQFLGTPPMNLLPGRLSADDGVLVAEGRSFRVPVGEGDDTDARNVFVGVRPEHLTPRGAGTEPGLDPFFHATVRAVEMLGNEVVALIAIGDTACAVRGPRDFNLGPGDPITLRCMPEQVHLFDGDSGRRLIRQDAHTPVVNHVAGVAAAATA